MLYAIDRLAHRFHGNVDEKSDSVVVMFADPDEARDCAHEIENSAQRKVSLCGCQITIEVEEFLEQIRNAGL